MKMFGAILNPLFKCDDHMINTRLFTQEKLQDGKEELLDSMARFFEYKSEAVVVEYHGVTQRSNKWSKNKDNRDEGSQTDMTCKEFDRFERWNDGKYFPQMKPLKVLAAIDDVGHLKEPMYVTVPVTHRGADVMHVKNHANYVDCQVLYNILSYMQDFKEAFINL